MRLDLDVWWWRGGGHGGGEGFAIRHNFAGAAKMLCSWIWFNFLSFLNFPMWFNLRMAEIKEGGDRVRGVHLAIASFSVTYPMFPSLLLPLWVEISKIRIFPNHRFNEMTCIVKKIDFYLKKPYLIEDKTFIFLK